MYDPLFLALAQAKSQPSHAYRATMSALNIPGEAIEGLSKGYQIRRMIQQPEALARVFAGTPQGQDILKTAGPDALVNAMYGLEPKDFMSEMGTQNRTNTMQQLGMAGISERNQASQRAYDASTQRTNAERDIFGGKNISSNIALHEGEISRLMKENGDLATKFKGGIAGIMRQWLTIGGAMPQELQDPQYSAIAGQMQQNAQRIKAHQAALVPMYKAQGMIPDELLKTMGGADMSSINPPGGDTSIPGEVLPGVSGF